MPTAHKAVIEDNEAGLRLDRWFKKRFPYLPHARIAKLIRTGQIRVDGARVKGATRLETGQTVRIPPHAKQEAFAAKRLPRVSSHDAKFIRNLVLVRDQHVIVINKPAGLAVQGGTKTHRHIDAMLSALKFESLERPRLVHRLDRDTSGVLALARSADAAAHLARSFKSKDTVKIYWAFCRGVPHPARGVIDLPLAKGLEAGTAREKMMPQADSAAGRTAVTYYSVVAHVARKGAWVALMPLTGRTHQLRAHCAAIGCPIIGDHKYGTRETAAGLEKIAKGLHLHARSLDIAHPADGSRLRVQAPLPDHMMRTWDYFEFDERDAGDPFREFSADASRGASYIGPLK